MLEWELISGRMLNARCNNLTTFLCHVATTESEEEDKEDWYEQLHQAIAKVPQHYMVLIIGDIYKNATVGVENSNYERAMGKHGWGVVNDSGERLVDRCLIIIHIIINGKWCREADTYSDHYLVIARIKLKLHRVVPQNQRQKELGVTRQQVQESYKGKEKDMKKTARSDKREVFCRRAGSRSYVCCSKG